MMNGQLSFDFVQHYACKVHHKHQDARHTMQVEFSSLMRISPSNLKASILSFTIFLSRAICMHVAAIDSDFL